MIRHAILINVKPGTPPETTQRMVAAVRMLPSEIPQIRSWEVGLGLNPTGATVGIVGLFDDAESFAEYLGSAAHHHCAQTYIAPIIEGATQVQFEVRGEDVLAETSAAGSPAKIEEHE